MARTTKALVRYGGANAATAEVDVIAPLGRAWGEGKLRDFLAAMRIEGGEPYVRRGDFTACRQNKKLGVELTFTHADAMKLRLREYPPDALMLTNIRFYGPKSRTHAAFIGALPFGLRSGKSRGRNWSSMSGRTVARLPDPADSPRPRRRGDQIGGRNACGRISVRDPAKARTTC